VKLFRRLFARQMSMFVGDVFVYLDSRGEAANPGDIVDVVSTALRGAGDPLVIVAHSMGGNIAYDVLTYYATDVHCTALVTVGSQVALFEEMKMFRLRDLGIRGPSGRVARPPNVDRWINVYDPIDMFAYLTTPVFSGTQDVPFGRAASPLAAHGDYFLRPEFYRELAKRL
jgi:pimeloyl-ACP methyl ester carboxylesterase